MTPAERQLLLYSYASSYRALSLALELFEAHDLDRAPAGEWTARQVVHHVSDAEVLRSAQLRTLLGGRRVTNRSVRPGPILENYDRPLEASLNLLRASVEANLTLLQCVSEDEWAKEEMRVESGPFAVEDWLRRAANHSHEHTEQLRRLAADA